MTVFIISVLIEIGIFEILKIYAEIVKVWNKT